MWKHLIIFVFVSACFAEELTSVSSARKKYHPGYHFFHPGLYYLTFLAIKAKIVIWIGFAISAFFAVGKFFALIKYATILFAHKKNCHESREPIILDRSPYFHEHYSGGHEHFSGGHDIHLDHPPYGDSPEYDHPPPTAKGRSTSDKLIDKINYVKDIIGRIDLTELTFKQMKIKGDECKKRFVCEIDQKAKSNTIIGLGLYMFTDMGFEKYRTKTPVDSIQDCARLYPKCSQNYKNGKR